MRNKGFTLIELLAVIVILAIIALIAVPIILNIIDSTKKSSNERSKELYLDAVEQAIAREKMKNIDYNPENCTVDGNGDLACVGYGEPLIVEVNGEKPKSGTIKLENGKVTENNLVFGDNSSEEKTTIVYSWSEDPISIGDTINPSNTIFKATPTEVENDNYLKHVIDKDNKVTETYACAVYNNKEYCLTSGEYGYAENESEYTGNLLILKGLQAEGLSCSFGEDESSCSCGEHIALIVYSNGNVNAYSEPANCEVYGDTSSCSV